MAGRALNPGEKDAFELIDQRGIKNRTLRAQVTSVDYTNGFVVVDLDGTPSGGKAVTVNPLWMSFPKGGSAAWGRFMPQASDVVKVSFDYDDSPHIVGYSVAAEEAGFPFGRVGWPQLNSLHTEASDDPTKTKSVTDANGNTTQVGIAKFAQFIPLNPGEFDFMSSGGAYVYGDNVGKLYMAGGSVSVSLIKDEMLIEQRSQLLTHIADDSTYRFGQNRRQDTSGLLSTLKIDPIGIYREFGAKLKTTTAPGVSLDLASFQIGNVVVDSGLLAEKIGGVDARFLLRCHNVGLQTFQMGASMLGDWQVDNLGNTTINTTKIVTVNAPKIKFQGPLGAPPAIHPLILTKIYEPAEKTMVTGLVTQINALTAQVAALNTALTAICAAFIIEIPAQIAAASSLPPILAATTALIPATQAVGTVFTTPYSTYLSQIASTG